MSGIATVGAASMLVRDTLLFVAVTKDYAIQSVLIDADPRMSHSEDLKAQKRWDFVTPKVTLTLPISDDANVAKVVVLRPIACASGGNCLQRIAEMNVPAPTSDQTNTPGR